jgi:hypothetical protein
MTSRIGFVLSVIVSATVLVAVGSQPTQACVIGKYFKNVVPVPFSAGLDGIDFTATPDDVTDDPQINFDLRSGEFNPALTGYVDNFAVEWTGWITPPVSGTYQFFTNSDDGSRLYIGSNLLVENNFYQGMTERSSAPIHLDGGVAYDFRVMYFQAGGGEGVIASWLLPDLTKEVIPLDVLTCPEPATLSLVALGGLAAILRRRRR